MKRLIIRISFSALLIALLGGGWLYYFITQNMDNSVNLAKPNQESVVWTIAKGSSLGQVNRELSAKNIIANPRLVSAYAVIFDQTEIQAGDYWIAVSSTVIQ